MCLQCEKKDKIIAVQAAEIERLRALRTTNREAIFKIIETKHGAPVFKPYELAPSFAPEEEVEVG